jgi:hypothetical protein
VAHLDVMKEHRMIRPGVNDLMAISVKPGFCGKIPDSYALTSELVRSISLDQSPIVEVIVQHW